MSVKDLKDYGRRAAQDPAVRARAKAIGLIDIRGQAAYAKTLGYTFDETDMVALAKEIAPRGELSERELAQVAGGVGVGAAASVVAVGGTPVPVSVPAAVPMGW